jgi:hypothetical protein
VEFTQKEIIGRLFMAIVAWNKIETYFTLLHDASINFIIQNKT